MKLDRLRIATYALAIAVFTISCGATRRPLASYLPMTVDGARRTLLKNGAPIDHEPDVLARYVAATFEIEISIYVTHAALGLRAMRGLRVGEQAQQGSSVTRGYLVDGFVVELDLGSFEVPDGATEVPNQGGIARVNIADRLAVIVHARRYTGATEHVLEITRTIDLRGLADYAKDLPKPTPLPEEPMRSAGYF